MSEHETPPAQAPATQPATDHEQPRAAVAESPVPAGPVAKNLPPYRVLLHNDDVNDMLYVTATLMELATLAKERALMVMMEAHQSGCALVLVTHKERAELYQEQFQSKQLVVTIEPVEV